MQVIKRQIYFSLSELTNVGISENTIKSAIKRGSRQWVCEKIDGLWWVCYDKMADKYKRIVEGVYGDVRSRVKEYQKLSDKTITGLEEVKAKPQDISYFRLKGYNTEDAFDKASAVAWLDFLGSIRGKRQAREYGYESKKELYKAAIDNHLKSIRALSITSIRPLQDRLKRYRSEGRDSVIHGNNGNDNSRKLFEAQQRYLLQCMCGGKTNRKITFENATYLYNKKAIVTEGWQTITEQAAYDYLMKPRQYRIWYAAQHGKKAAYNKFDPSVNREHVLARNRVWAFDGTPIDLYFKETIEYFDKVNRKWTTRTDYWKRIQVVATMDVHSWKIIGYSLCENENHVAVMSSLRDAVRKTGVTPEQLRHDKSSASGAVEEFLLRMQKYHIPSKPHNPKSKEIENLFGKFQSMVLRYMEEWAGMNISAKTERSRMNPDLFDKSKLPTRDELIEKIEELVNIWNTIATKNRKSPNYLYEKSEATCAGREIDPITFTELFWVTRKVPYKYRSDGINFKVNRKNYTFKSLDEHQYLDRLIHQKFHIKYDPDMLDDDDCYIYLYQNDELVLDNDRMPIILVKATYHPNAVSEHSEGTREKLNTELVFKKQVTKKIWGDVKEVMFDNEIEVTPQTLYGNGESDEFVLAAETALANGSDVTSKKDLNAAETLVKQREIKSKTTVKVVKKQKFSEIDWDEIYSNS